MKLAQLLALGKLATKVNKPKPYYFDKDGNLHITELDYNDPRNQPNHAFPKGTNK